MSDDQKLSSLERLLQADEQRQHHLSNGTIPLVQYQPLSKSEGEMLRDERFRAARLLPDEMFEGDAELQRLKAVHLQRQVILKNRLAVRRWLELQQQRTEASIEDAESAVVWGVLCDAANDDGGMLQARAALSQLQAVKDLSVFVAKAYEMVAVSSPGALRALDEGVAQARTALQDQLLALKLAHVDAQQIEQGGA